MLCLSNVDYITVLSIFEVTTTSPVIDRLPRVMGKHWQTLTWPTRHQAQYPYLGVAQFASLELKG